MKAFQFQRYQNLQRNHKFKPSCGFWNISEAQILRGKSTQFKEKWYQWETNKIELKGISMQSQT
jgi:hypothetical protein